MIPEDVEALALADAIGMLEPDEQRQLRKRLDTLRPDQRADVARLYDVAATIAATDVTDAPRPAVRAQLLARIADPSRYTLAAHEGEWRESGIQGIRAKILAVNQDQGFVTLLLRAVPGAVYPSHRHSGAEECYVLSGSVVIDGRVLEVGDFHHADAGSDHAEITTTSGADVLLVGAVADYLPGSR